MLNTKKTREKNLTVVRIEPTTYCLVRLRSSTPHRLSSPSLAAIPQYMTCDWLAANRFQLADLETASSYLCQARCFCLINLLWTEITIYQTG